MAYLKWSKKVPSQLVAHRAASTYTPTSWSEVTTARGRCIVGVPSGGTDGATQGTALTDNQNKSKSIAHTHTGPSHSHLQGFGFIGEFSWNNTFTHGTGAVVTINRYMTNQTTYPAYDTPNIQTKVDGTGNTSAMSANATVATSDILAYVQLMAIKKD